MDRNSVAPAAGDLAPRSVPDQAAHRAKVFISCGQRSGSERETARAIADRLQRRGFAHYIAVNEASLKGLVENVYGQLKTSEYFLFVDFRREQLPGVSAEQYRGSLFSHQELAVAAYLELPCLLFRQRDVERNGIMGFVLANTVDFTDASELPALVDRKIESCGWSHDWRNALVIERTPTESSDMLLDSRDTRWFHAAVRNLHRDKVAVNSVAYVKAIRDMTGATRVPPTVELAWAGYKYPTATIAPRSSRDFDLGFVYQHQPGIFHFNRHTTSGRFNEPIQGPGRFELDYAVVAENFVDATVTVELTLGRSLDDVRIVTVGG